MSDAGTGEPLELLFVNLHYWPDVASTGQHLTDLAEHLAGRGIGVTVVAGRARYLAGKVDAPAREVRNGVRIVRVEGTGFGRRTHLGRIVDYAAFYLRVLFFLLFGKRADGVVFLTTPPLLPLVGRIVRALRGTPYGIWSMDLHPDAEIAAGMLRREGLLAKVLLALNHAGYRGADLVVDLGAYMKQRIVGMGVLPERTHTVHVWSDRAEVEPIAREDNPLIAELGLGDRFVVMYSGNAGLVHDFDAILEAMRLLRDDASIFFLFVGGGPRRPAIERFAEEHSLSQFTYREYFPRDRLRYSLSLADAHLISLREAFIGISVPGKLYGIMASERPAIFVGPSRCESADTVREAGCGTVIDAADPKAGASLARTIRAWRADGEAVAAMGRRGRAEFLRRFEREPNCAAFERVLRDTWNMPISRKNGSADEGSAVVQAVSTLG